jgi:hypothetical protein
MEGLVDYYCCCGHSREYMVEMASSECTLGLHKHSLIEDALWKAFLSRMVEVGLALGKKEQSFGKKFVPKKVFD